MKAETRYEGVLNTEAKSGREQRAGQESVISAPGEPCVAGNQPGEDPGCWRQGTHLLCLSLEASEVK